MTASLAIAKIIPFLSVSTNIAADAEYASLIEGATHETLEHDGQNVDVLLVPACDAPPTVADGVVSGLPKAEAGVFLLVPAVVFGASDRKDLCQYDPTTNVKNIAPKKGVAYQRGFVFKKQD